MTETVLKYHGHNVNLIIKNGIVNNTWSFLEPNRRYIVITDNNLAKIYGHILQEIPGLETILAIKPGEKSKCITVYQKLLSALIKINIKRNDILIAFGGGVVGDMTGFVASTILRGIEYIQIPTSLVAQIDSSIGGKCGMDYEGKNMVGSFYHPSNIIIDPTLLKTLPEIEFANGIGEMLKYGFIRDEKIFTELENTKVDANSENLVELIERCVNIKHKLILKDEFDFNERRLLNFGHTYGHVIENLSNYKIPHGKAVAQGMYYELEDFELKDRLLNAMKKYNLSEGIEKWQIDYRKHIINDKKSTLNTITMVRVNKIGRGKLYTKDLYN